MTIYETDTDRYKTYSGSAWEDGLKSGEWVTYTPTISSAGTGTDWSLGNGTVQGRYQRVGRLIVGQASVVFGSTSVFGTKDLVVIAPVAFDARATDTQAIGVCNATDDSLGNGYPGLLLQTQSTSTQMRPAVSATAGSYTTRESITSTVPFSWTNGDKLTLLFAYEAASA